MEYEWGNGGRVTFHCLIKSWEDTKKEKEFNMKKTLQISFAIVVVDQFIKFLARMFLMGQEIVVIPKFFSLLYTLNPGAAWSLFSGNRIFLILITFLFLGFLYFFFLKDQHLKIVEKVGIGFLIGGILGNLVDRIFFGYVIDYLSFTFFNYSFPIFNFADTCIVGSIFFLIFVSVSEVIPWKLK